MRRALDRCGLLLYHGVELFNAHKIPHWVIGNGLFEQCSNVFWCAVVVAARRCNPRDYLESNLYDAHVGKSMYALQLSRWFAFFGRESFKVTRLAHEWG